MILLPWSEFTVAPNRIAFIQSDKSLIRHDLFLKITNQEKKNIEVSPGLVCIPSPASEAHGPLSV